MKIITAAFVSILLMVSSAVTAQDYAPTKTYESTVHKMRLPTAPNGTLAVRQSNNDDFETYRVTDRTLYQLNGKAMQLEDFRIAIEELRAQGDENVNVVRDIGTDTIIRVFITTQ